MPTPPVTSTYAEIVMHGLMAAAGSNSVPTANVFHYRRTAGTTSPNKAALSVIFQSAVGDIIAAALNARWAATFNSIRFMGTSTDAYIDFGSSAVGAISGDSMASFDAAMFLCRTGLRGKHYQGRKHFGPMSESDSTGTSDVFNSACLTRLASIATALVTPFTDSDGNTWRLSVFSPSLSVVDSDPTSIIGNDVTQVRVNHVVGTMKRRKVRSIYA